MKLIAERLDVIVDGQIFLKGFDIVGILVPGRQDAYGDLDMLGVLGIHHGGMHFRSRRERGSFPGCQRHNLHWSKPH